MLTEKQEQEKTERLAKLDAIRRSPSAVTLEVNGAPVTVAAHGSRLYIFVEERPAVSLLLQDPHEPVVELRHPRDGDAAYSYWFPGGGSLHQYPGHVDNDG